MWAWNGAFVSDYTILDLSCFQDEHIDENDIRRCISKSTTSRMAVFLTCLPIVTFIVPLMIIIHNYSRVSHTLIKSLKQNTQLMEGSQQEQVSLYTLNNFMCIKAE